MSVLSFYSRNHTWYAACSHFGYCFAIDLKKSNVLSLITDNCKRQVVDDGSHSEGLDGSYSDALGLRMRPGKKKSGRAVRLINELVSHASKLLRQLGE